MSRSKVSIKDVARTAGVSFSTVSRALSGSSLVKAETRELIEQVALEMGYSPNLPARSLVTRDMATIGMVITEASDPFLGQLVVGVEERARANGYSVFLSTSYRLPDREREAIRALYERRSSGIVVTGTQLDTDYEQVRRRFPVPMVFINSPVVSCSVSTDNETGAHHAMAHLLDLGHRRIAYVANARSERSNRARLNGYKGALEKARIPFDEALVIDGGGSLQGGARAGRALLALPHPPTAIFCFNDLMAVGVLHALYEAGTRVPEDVSVSGFDDLELASFTHPPLTTVRQDGYQLGWRAMSMLLRLIDGEDADAPEVVPASLIVRKTTGPIPASYLI